MTAIRNAADFFDGVGLDLDEVDCHNTGASHTPLHAPWRDADREGDKTRLYEYLRYQSDGTPIRKVVRDVFGSEAAAGDADYQLARRFFERYPEFFKIARRDGSLWVEPRLQCYTGLNLRQQYARRKTSGRRRDGSTGVETGGETGDLDGGDGRQYAKERTRSYLDSYLQVDSDSVKRSLLKQLITDKAGTEDRWQIFERIRGTGDRYRFLPYRTRFNDAGRSTAVRDRFERGLQAAGSRYQAATVLTLTTDPKQHDGLSEAIENLSENKGRLMSWFSTEYQLGHRPENMTVLEFTESGLPHYHVVLFGVRPASLPSRQAISEKWQDYGQAIMVDLSTATTTHNGDQWRLHDDRSGTVTLAQYLGKAIRGLQSVATADAADLQDRVDDGDISGWKQSLYWATERQYVTCSPSLKATDDDGDGDDGDPDLPHITVWRFVGVSSYENIPAHVRQSGTFGVG